MYLQKLLSLVIGTPIACALFLSVTGTTYANYTTLHEFEGDEDTWSGAEGSVIVEDSIIYGMHPYLGSYGDGAIYSINTDGSNFTLLKEFFWDDEEYGGAEPFGSLILDGSTLYGMTSGGGAAYKGNIFSINTDGSNFSTLHEFAGKPLDGEYPWDSLILDGSTLYGMTTGGGANDNGVIFSINTDGTDYSILYEFNSDIDGNNPNGSLFLADSILYGMTRAGGSANEGIVFSINSDGTDFTVLHEFLGGADDGADATGSLVVEGSKIYGMTKEGGDTGDGTVFSMNTDGTGFTLLHEFIGEGLASVGHPFGSLILNDSVLYGMTRFGGETEDGIIFSINTDGSNYSELHEFRYYDFGGYYPSQSLFLSNSILYGMTSFGGSDDVGTIFAFDLREPVPDPEPSPSPEPTDDPQPSPEPSSTPSDDPIPDNKSSKKSFKPSSTTKAPTCTDIKPAGTPDLFQIDVNNNRASLYFAPILGVSKYFIAYGEGEATENHGVEFYSDQSTGVVSFNISDLLPDSFYSFKVRGGNGCMPGDWSNIVQVKTKSTPQGYISYFRGFAAKLVNSLLK